jgi:hypothetical protein
MTKFLTVICIFFMNDSSRAISGLYPVIRLECSKAKPRLGIASVAITQWNSHQFSAVVKNHLDDSFEIIVSAREMEVLDFTLPVYETGSLHTFRLRLASQDHWVLSGYDVDSGSVFEESMNCQLK